jgi:hypothetical protein
MYEISTQIDDEYAQYIIENNMKKNNIEIIEIKNNTLLD